jgi:hypothetical protein
MTKIKINIKNANTPLSQREYDRLAEDKNTINLSDRKTTKQIKRSIENRKQFNHIKEIMK